MNGEVIFSQDGMALLDLDFIDSVARAIGPQAHRNLIDAFIRDCRASARRLSDKGAMMGGPALGRDSHRFAGMLAQFGCPAAASAFRAASHSASGDMPRLVREAIALVEPTCAAMETLLARQAA